MARCPSSSRCRRRFGARSRPTLSLTTTKTRVHCLSQCWSSGSSTTHKACQHAKSLQPTFCLKEAMSKSPPADDRSEGTPDLFSLMDRSSLPGTSRRVIQSSSQIRELPPERADFLHAVLCQVGMPRKQSKTRVFERSSGTVSMRLEARTLFQRGKFVDQPLPYGTRPRLVMVHISGEAVRTGSREVHIGDSMREFLITLSIEPSGGPRGGYTMFKKQMEALAASRLTLGMSVRSRDVTINTQPISRFEAWLTHDGKQRGLWPGVMELSQEFYDTHNPRGAAGSPRARRAQAFRSGARHLHMACAPALPDQEARGRNGELGQHARPVGRSTAIRRTSSGSSGRPSERFVRSILMRGSRTQMAGADFAQLQAANCQDECSCGRQLSPCGRFALRAAP